MTQELQPQPPVRWRQAMLKGTLWLSSELVLGLIGMDTIADYGEFLMNYRMAEHLGQAIATLTTLG